MMSKAQWQNGSEYVIITRGDDFSDAICATPLAKMNAAPILLSQGEKLDDEVLAELTRLKPKQVFIIGGKGAVSENIEVELQKMAKVDRISGVDRYSTSVEVAKRLGTVNRAVMVTGNDFADAISISAVAAIEKMPVLLSLKNSVPAVTEEYIKNANLEEGYIIGGEGALGKEVEGAFKKFNRISGVNRYETSVKIIDYFRNDFDFGTIYLSGGGSGQFADALVGSAAAAVHKNPMLLVENDNSEYLNQCNFIKDSKKSNLLVLGGQDSVSNDAVRHFKGIIMGDTVKDLFKNAKLTTFAGSGEMGEKQGKKAGASFQSPWGMVKDKNGDLYIVDSNNNRIEKIQGDEISTFSGLLTEKDFFGIPLGGFQDGVIGSARFNKPRDLVQDKEGNIYVADTGNNVIRKITNGQVFTFAGTGEKGYKDGSGDQAQFNTPSGITIDGVGNIYVADTLNNVIRVITPKGIVSTFAGEKVENGGAEDGKALDATFNEPSDVVIDNLGGLFVADSGNQLIRKIENGRVTTYAGTRGEKNKETGYLQGGYEDGKNAKFNFPKGLAVTEEGVLLVTDTYNHKIRMIALDGTVSTLLESEIDAEKTENQSLESPISLLYVNESLYVADRFNNRIYIVKN